MPWHLVAKNLLAHPIRTTLTVLSLVFAVFLVCTLRSLIVGLEAGVVAAAQNRLIVQSAVSLFVDLPLAYQAKLEAVEGVALTTRFQWFGGVYQDPSNFFAQFGVDPEKFFDMYPEVRLVEGTAEAFRGKRTACVIGDQLAKKFGWRVGDRIPILGTIFTRRGGEAWEFDVAGVYHSDAANVDNQTMYFHFDYLRETLEQGGADGPPGVGVFILRTRPGADQVRIMSAVDALFENGPQRVQCTTEAEFNRQFVSMLGSVPTFLGSIGGSVLFAIFLAVLNTMLMAGRERTRDIGIIKALGWSDATAFGLLLSESVLLCAIGGGLGIAVALLSARALGGLFQTIVPFYEVTPETVGLAAGVTLALGVFAGLAPAWRASRLRVVQALRPDT